MSIENLTAYLQEHAAGAAAALDLLDHLISRHTGTPDEKFFRQLSVEIHADKTTLDKILHRCQATESVLLNTLTRLGEKAARAKFLLAGPGHGDLGRYEALEMLSLGIEGKRLLWLSLETAVVPKLKATDFPALIKAAASQRKRVERRRLNAAREAFATAR